MKRSQLRRTAFKPRKIAPGVKRLRQTRIKQVGARKKREAKAEEAFREAVKLRDRDCVICRAGRTPEATHFMHMDRTLRMGSPPYNWGDLEAHHMCGKGRAGGHPETHNPKNGVALCRHHHRETHDGWHPEYIKSIKWLDSLNGPA